MRKCILCPAYCPGPVFSSPIAPPKRGQYWHGYPSIHAALRHYVAPVKICPCSFIGCYLLYHLWKVMMIGQRNAPKLIFVAIRFGCPHLVYGWRVRPGPKHWFYTQCNMPYGSHGSDANMPYTEHWIALICPLTGQQIYLLLIVTYTASQWHSTNAVMWLYFKCLIAELSVK